MVMTTVVNPIENRVATLSGISHSFFYLLKGNLP